ncbi:hypothetical protein DHOM_11345 [Dermabacter hominis 1368]|uniref:Uncharacterized protein n=1 Tax=Dermabacter hominis 1368 TaxID=1450519 RepID=A0ABR4SGS8_9MICO|nr:hypothetical protein DHOM_11345 [Dermabacter hominis 1368]
MELIQEVFIAWIDEHKSCDALDAARRHALCSTYDGTAPAMSDEDDRLVRLSFNDTRQVVSESLQFPRSWIRIAVADARPVIGDHAAVGRKVAHDRNPVVCAHPQASLTHDQTRPLAEADRC